MIVGGKLTHEPPGSYLGHHIILSLEEQVDLGHAVDPKAGAPTPIWRSIERRAEVDADGEFHEARVIIGWPSPSLPPVSGGTT